MNCSTSRAESTPTTPRDQSGLATISIARAITIAERHVGGEATRAQRTSAADGSQFAIDFTTPRGEFTVIVDGRNGEVASIRCNVAPCEDAAIDGKAYRPPPKRERDSNLLAAIYAGFNTGQLAGMNNTILEPKFTLGTQISFTPTQLPEWENHANLYLIYGASQTGQGTTGNALQELRGSVYSGYQFYNDKNISKAGVGLYSEFAAPFHRYAPYHPAQSQEGYAAEEGDITSRELLTGLDLKFSFKNDRLQSEFDNVAFLSGTRIGPNLETYTPLLGMRWHNDFFMLGNSDSPKLSLFTDINFYFARKANTAVLNAHDGLGGTKRELFLSYGLSYFWRPGTSLNLRSYGYNNLNRGSSATVPYGFRDGMMLSISHDL